MTCGWLALPGALCAALFIMMQRRLISPVRFAQALALVAVAVTAVLVLRLALGAGHGG